MNRVPALAQAGIVADPFGERRPRVPRMRMQLLGARFEFECESAELRSLVEAAYAGLPGHRLGAAPPRLRVRLAWAPGELWGSARGPARGSAQRASRGSAQRASRGSACEPPPVAMCSGADLLCGTTACSSFAVISAAERAALIVLSRALRRFPYHARYELLEFAVFTLAARVQGFVPLHAACIGRRGRGVLVMGESGAGKTTAALHCLLRGCDFVAEDSVFVDPVSMRATGVGNFLHLRRDALRFLSGSSAALVRRSPTIARRSGIEKFEVDVRQPPFRLARRPLAVGAVVFASSRSADEGPLLVRLDRASIPGRLEAAQPYAARLPGWAAFRRALRTAPAFELRRGHHPLLAAEALDTLLSPPRVSPPRAARKRREP